MEPTRARKALEMSAITELSYRHGASPDPLLGETIGDNLRRVAATHAGFEALVDVPTGQRWTYAQLDADTDDVARGLIAAGVAKGDRVGIWAPNCAEWVLLQYGTAKMGAILVNINPAYRSHELGYVLRQAGISLLVSAESFRTSDYRAMIEEVRGEQDHGLRVRDADDEALPRRRHPGHRPSAARPIPACRDRSPARARALRRAPRRSSRGSRWS